ncbi:MAG TPA: 50S ribosomal protein L4 [Candidatus Dojkabacteria bacterium]|nr:50S ribosomal protein L4 [Candidatus Dojkabacteria bacterium]
MEVNIYNIKKEEVGKLELPDSIFNVEFRKDLVEKYLRVYLNNQRAFSATVKGRGDVRGGGRKPWKQKGTGRARHGSTRSPIWVGGGVSHGPEGIKTMMSMNKKEKVLLYRSILSELMRRGMLFWVKDFEKDYDEKTSISKGVSKILKSFGDGAFVYVRGQEEGKFSMGVRNLPNVLSFFVDGVDWMSFLYGDVVLMDVDAWKKLELSL